MNTTDALCEQVMAIIRQAVGLPDHIEILPDTKLAESLGIDSLKVVRIVLALQDELGLVFDEGKLDIADFATPLTISSLVRNWRKDATEAVVAD